MVRRGRARPASIFPLRLGRQPAGAAFFLAQPLAEGERVIPGDLRYGMRIFVLLDAWVFPIQLGPVDEDAFLEEPSTLAIRLGSRFVSFGLHKLLELPHGYLGSGHVEGLADDHMVLWHLAGQHVEKKLFEILLASRFAPALQFL